MGNLLLRSTNQTFPDLCSVEDCRRAVWTSHAGFHTGGHTSAWDEDFGYHNCTLSLGDKLWFGWALDCYNDTRSGKETSPCLNSILLKSLLI